jgi:DNA-directed RNA polymerase omega subunit
MFKIPENLESKYRFVMLAALRAEQLQSGAIPRVESDSIKPTVVAQEEVAAGVVEQWDGTEPQPAELPAEPGV